MYAFKLYVLSSLYKDETVKQQIAVDILHWNYFINSSLFSSMMWNNNFQRTKLLSPVKEKLLSLGVFAYLYLLSKFLWFLIIAFQGFPMNWVMKTEND